MKRSEQKIQTRQNLLKAAFREFSEEGLIATNTLDIARSAEVSHGTLFVHFPTRELLLMSVIDEFGLRMGAKLQQLAADKTNAADVLSAHLETLEEYESFYARLIVEGPLLPSSIRHRIFLIQSGIAHHLEKVIPKKLPLHFVLNSWLGLIHYYLANRDLFAPRQSVIKKCGHELLTHFIQTFQL